MATTKHEDPAAKTLTNRGEDVCMDLLKKCSIDVEQISHPIVTTVDAWTPHVEKTGGVVAKNMFLKGKKGELVLVFALATTKTDIKLVCKAVGASSGSLRMAPEELLNDTLGVIQGAVTPLALVNDTKKVVQLVLDADLLKCDKLLAVHPCRNDRTVLLTKDQLVAVFDALQVKPIVVDFAAAPDAAVAAAGGAPSGAKQQQQQQQKKKSATATATATAAAAADESGETKLGLDVKKDENFSEWYSQVITKSEMIEYYDVSGCYIVRPWAFDVWEHIRTNFAQWIRDDGVEECYFPMFVSKHALEKEKDHIEGFAPEVAWVTKSGSSDLDKPVAIRPSSETIMYPAYAKWLRSHRDLPLRLNQWCNVVRWEFSHPTPFIRTREFLWQEGHSAYETPEEADKEVRTILGFYRRVYEDLLAVPVVEGRKTQKEKFAGGAYTTTVEGFIPDVGRGVQGATSHSLGQNFAKMAGIEIEDAKKNKKFVWQNSWGITTRTIGVMVMLHGDDKGLVMPPRVSSVQVIIIPTGLTSRATEADRDRVFAAAHKLQKDLRAAGVRAKVDTRINYTTGWRYNYWELKGVPVRAEVGPKELDKGVITCATRYNFGKETLTLDDSVGAQMHKLLNNIHDGMLKHAWEVRRSRTRQLTDWAKFTLTLNEKCLIMAPWCGEEECENGIKRDSGEESKAMQAADLKEDERAPSMGAKALCIPFEQPKEDVTQHKCICKACNAKAKSWVLFGRSF